MNISELPKHHAILLEYGERGAIGASLFAQLQSLSPIHTFFNQTVLDIEIARKIITWANTPYNEEKIALISFHTIGLEAQNALLKILEEPRDGVRFILLTSNKANLIDTVLSRLLFVRDNKDIQVANLAHTFLTTSCTLRMKLPEIIELLSRVDEEERKDREGVRAFILSLATVLQKNNSPTKYTEETLETASYAADPSASGKALVEYLALLLPQIKD